MAILPSKKDESGRTVYEVSPGRWVSRQRVGQMRDRKRHLARRNVHSALKRGKLKRQPCEICGEPNAEVHHFSYDDPWAIQWLCKKHHNRPRSHLPVDLEPPHEKTGPKKGKRLSPMERIAAARKKMLDSGVNLFHDGQMPPKMSYSEKEKRWGHVRVPPDVLDELRETAKKDRRTLTAVLRLAWEHYKAKN